MSHKSVTRLITQLGKDHDQVVKNWRDSFLLDLETLSVPSYSEQCENNESTSESDSCEYSSEEDNIELVDDDSCIISSCTCSSDDITCSSDDVACSSDYAPEQFHSGPLMVCPPQVLEASNIIKILPGLPIQMKHKGFRLCGDNLDKSIRRRHLRSDKRNQSLHYFHAYAVENRIDVSGLSEVCPNISEITDIKCAAESILPQSRDDMIIKENITVLVSRVLYQYFNFFKLSFDGVIQWHIKHKNYTEMSCKSVVVCYTISFEVTMCLYIGPIGYHSAK